MKLAKSIEEWNLALPTKSYKFKDSLIGQKIQRAKVFGEVTQLILDKDVIAISIGALKESGLPFELEVAIYQLICANPLKFEKVGKIKTHQESNFNNSLRNEEELINKQQLTYKVISSKQLESGAVIVEFEPITESNSSIEPVLETNHKNNIPKSTKILKLLDRSKFNMIEMGYYLAFYHKAVDGQQDLVSNLILRFKDDDEPETTEWVQLATSFFSGKYKPDIIIRVLKSEEISPSSNTSLDKLGKAIAQKIGSRYEPSALTKIRQTRPLKFLKKHKRFEEINGVYRYGGLKVKNILVLDDIITTSTTITEIKRAIVSSIGDVNLRLFVLGKTFDAWNDGEGDNAEIEQFFSKTNAEF